MQGYFLNADCTAIVSMHKVLANGITDKPSNFFESEDLGGYIDVQRDKHGKIVALKKGKPYEPTDEEIESQSIAREIAQWQSVLNGSDYQVVKCAERGLDFAQNYPELKEEREKARLKISELRESLK